jgi:long-chain acyl-CoA synthetase
VRRRFIADKYQAVVEALYAGAEAVELAAEITLEDGRKTVLRSLIAINDIEAIPEPSREPAYA